MKVVILQMNEQVHDYLLAVTTAHARRGIEPSEAAVLSDLWAIANAPQVVDTDELQKAKIQSPGVTETEPPYSDGS